MDAQQVDVFLQQAAEARKLVESHLDKLCRFPDDCPQRLQDAIRHSLFAPGKRLRPLLVLSAAEACGSNKEVAMPAACAVEMIHTYSLIHDDLPAMDDDELRRGLPTCHIAFDEATAILAGDGLLTLAFETITKLEPAPVAVSCCRELAIAAGVCGMVGGQSDDLSAEHAEGSLDLLQKIHRRKTGALLVGALRMGALTAQASSEQIDALTTYGQKLGLAFQIVDDLLDLHGDSTTLGKNPGQDASHGKLTFPGLLGEQESRRRAEELIDDAIDALRDFESEAKPLRSLAMYVLDRNH